MTPSGSSTLAYNCGAELNVTSSIRPRRVLFCNLRDDAVEAFSYSLAGT